MSSTELINSTEKPAGRPGILDFAIGISMPARRLGFLDREEYDFHETGIL